MATLKIYGKVVAVLPQQIGTSKSGKQWFSQQFLVEEVSGRDGEYTNQVCFTLMNANLNEKNVLKHAPHFHASPFRNSPECSCTSIGCGFCAA